jgi:predicted PurR-regulated permease PerM
MLVYLTIKLISANISEIKETLPLYQEKLSHTLVSISLFFGVDESIANIPSMLKSLNFKNLVATTLEVANGIISSTFTIFIYLMFLLLEYKTFDKKLKAIFTTDAQYSQAKYIVDSISADVMTYFKIKTTISLALAILVYAILEIVGVNFASFWAILTFLLNFIPTFGSIIATIFPVIMALVQFDTLYPMVIVFSSLIGLQFVLGNIIEPKISGESLNLSPMVIMLSLVLWGEIWGVIGMLLCVPMMVVLNIILSNFEQTKWIAIIFSEDGEIRHAKVEKNI